MTWTTMTDPIPVQLGVKMYDMYASGTIYKGQAVAISPNLSDYVWVPDISSQHLFGVAGYNATQGEKLGVWGLYNIVNAEISGATSAGTFVGTDGEGKFSPYAKYKDAVLLETTTTAGEVARVFLWGPSGAT